MRESMEIYPITAMERAMKLQEVLLRATSGKIKWWQAAELIGISERQMRRWRKRLEDEGPQGLLDRRRRKPSSRRVAKKQADEVVGLYRDRYFDLNVRHFHEKLGEEHQIGLSYTWVKQALQAAGLVKRKSRRGVHRKRRERRPLPGMMLHIDGSEHHWFQDERKHGPDRDPGRCHQRYLLREYQKDYAVFANQFPQWIARHGGLIPRSFIDDPEARALFNDQVEPAAWKITKRWCINSPFDPALSCDPSQFASGNSPPSFDKPQRVEDGCETNRSCFSRLSSTVLLLLYRSAKRRWNCVSLNSRSILPTSRFDLCGIGSSNRDRKIMVQISYRRASGFSETPSRKVAGIRQLLESVGPQTTGSHLRRDCLSTVSTGNEDLEQS